MANDKEKSQVESQPDDSVQKKKSSKTVLIVSLVVGGFFALLFVLLMLLVLVGIMSGSSVATYKTTDLVPVSNSDISFTRPKQWVDASYVDKLNDDFGLDLSNQSAYADEIVTDKNGQTDVATAFVIFGKSSGDKTDLEVVKTPEFRSKFEELMGQQFTVSKLNSESDLCEEVGDFKINYNYDFNNFPVSVAIKFNCLVAESKRDSYNATSLEVRMAMVIAKDGNTYIYMLVATDESWAKNEPVYLHMLEDFKAV